MDVSEQTPPVLAPSTIEEALQHHRRGIEEALCHSTTMTYDDVVRKVNRGELLVAYNSGAILICGLDPLRDGWMLTMFVGAGDMDELMKLVDSAEALAKQNGVSVIACIGRPGWIKEGRKRGYRVETVVYVKEI